MTVRPKKLSQKQRAGLFDDDDDDTSFFHDSIKSPPLSFLVQSSRYRDTRVLLARRTFYRRRHAFVLSPCGGKKETRQKMDTKEGGLYVYI